MKRLFFISFLITGLSIYSSDSNNQDNWLQPARHGQARSWMLTNARGPEARAQAKAQAAATHAKSTGYQRFAPTMSRPGIDALVDRPDSIRRLTLAQATGTDEAPAPQVVQATVATVAVQEAIRVLQIYLGTASATERNRIKSALGFEETE